MWANFIMYLPAPQWGGRRASFLLYPVADLVNGLDLIAPVQLFAQSGNIGIHRAGGLGVAAPGTLHQGIAVNGRLAVAHQLLQQGKLPRGQLHGLAALQNHVGGAVQRHIKGLALFAALVLWNLEPVFAAMIADVKAGSYGSHNYDINLKDGSVDLLHTKNIPDDVWAEVMKAKQDIIDGKIVLTPHYDAAAVHALVTQN